MPRFADLAAQLIPVAVRRREQALVRAAAAGTAAVAFAYSLNLPWLWAWLAAYAAAQLLEVWALWPFRADRPAPGPARAVAALATIALLAAAFGLMAPLLWRAPAPVGPAAAVLLLCASVLNVLATSRGCTPAFVAGTTPYLLLLLALPWSGGEGVSRTLGVTFALAAGLCGLSVGLVWREGLRAQRAEARALDEAREGQARALAAWEARQSFVAAVGHELRTPLTALTAAASVLELRAFGPEERSTAALIGHSAELMRRLLDDLLDLAKLEAGRMEVETAPFALRALVLQAAELWRGPAEAKGLRLVLDTIDALPERVTGDAHRVQQLLNNLLSNAVKFTEAGEVRLACAAALGEDGRWEAAVTVTDTGRGLTHAELAGLFEPFAQHDAAVPRIYGGTGLGLAISRKLARVMGGDLTSLAGAGGRFELRLRLGAVEAARPAVEAPSAPGWGARLRVLVVDDHPMARRGVQLVLETLGATVEVAEGGADALTRLAVTPFDLVVMDVNMEGMDGREACRRLRGAPGPNRAAAVLALTGEAGASQVAACLAAGMDAHVAKPITPARLYAASTSALAAADRRGSAARESAA